MCVFERERGGGRERHVRPHFVKYLVQNCASRVSLCTCVLCVSALTSAKTQFPSFLFFCQHWARPERPWNTVLLNVQRSEEA